MKILRIPELRRRLFITLGLLLVYRLGLQIPLPGIDLARIEEAVRTQSGSALGAIFGMMNAFTGSSIQSCALFSLGIMPYISASIILSILVKVVPSLEALAKEGSAGQKKINQYTRYLTVPICLFQSLFIVFGVIYNETFNYVAPGQGGAFFTLALVIALTSGTLFLMWLGEQITEYGIGNGISLIIMVGIIGALPGAVSTLLAGTVAQDDRLQILTLLGAVWVICVFAIVYVTKGQRRIAIQQAKLTRGNKIYGGQRHFLPLKVNQSGVMPIIFASAVFMFPSVLGSLVGWNWLQQIFSSGTGFVYIVTYSALIFFFSFFWTKMMYQPDEMANNLKEGGSFIPGIRPGRRTAEFLDFTMTRLALAGASFLAVIALFPNIIQGSFPQLGIAGFGLTAFLGGTSILIVVGVALDMVERLNAHLVMHNYEAYGKGSSSRWGAKK